MSFDRAGFVTQLKERYVELEQQLEQFRAIETELRQVQRAITALTGEKPAGENGEAGALTDKQIVLLRAIRDGHTTITEIQDATGVSKTNVSSRCNQFKNQGLTKPNGKVGLMISWKLTDKGLAALEQAGAGEAEEDGGSSNEGAGAGTGSLAPGRSNTGNLKSEDTLKVLARHPGYNKTQILGALGFSDNKLAVTRMHAQLPYLRHQQLIKAQGDGWVLTSKGKDKVAKILTQ